LISTTASAQSFQNNVFLEIGVGYDVYVDVSTYYCTLELSVGELEWLLGVVAAEECSLEHFIRKTLWQECRRHLPAEEMKRTPLFPPGF